jgi:hypothetical protein
MAKSLDIVAEQATTEASILRESLGEAHKTLENYALNYERLEEKLSGLDLQLDNIGWSESYGYDDEGPSLNQVKAMSKQIRNLMAKNVWVKQGWQLRSNYVNAGGTHMAKIPGQNATGSGRKTAAWLRVQHPKNQRVFFSTTARVEREGALYADSVSFFIGNERDYTLSAFPINQLTADYRDPDDPSEVWAYRRTWYSYQNGSLTPTEKSEWIFHNWHIDKRTKSVKYNNKVEPVSQTKRVFGRGVNSLPGWAYGVPDAFSGISWARQYREVLLNGKTMTDALASVAYKLINKSRKGAQTAGARIASNTSAGNVANLVEGQDMAAMNTAGKGYDFDTARPLLAAFAAGIGVSVVAVASDPGAAGSSYGASATLDLPTRLMVEVRREYHIELDKEVLAWMGAPDADVWFDPIEDWSEALRAMQTFIAKWNTGLYSESEMKADIEGFFGKLNIPAAPDGVLLPNNKDSLERRDIDTDGSAVAPGAGAAPGQGQSTGTGDTGTNNDQRTDNVS